MNNLGGLFTGSQNSPSIETGYNPQANRSPYSNTLPGMTRVNRSYLNPRFQTSAPWSIMPPLNPSSSAAPAPLSGLIYVPPVARGFPPNAAAPAPGIPVASMATSISFANGTQTLPRPRPTPAGIAAPGGYGPAVRLANGAFRIA